MALKELTEAKLADMRDLLQERYATQTKALDAAFLAQQAAVATSFNASEKAMAAALLAAKEAVEKANAANDKRFDSVNAFRSQLADIQTTLVPRNEADAKFSAYESRLTDIKSTIDKGFTGMSAKEQAGSQWRKTHNDQMALTLAGGSVIVTTILAILTGLHLFGH
jgi:hypothetical protein